MTTSDAAMSNAGVRTALSIRVAARLNFFIVSDLIRLAETKKSGEFVYHILPAAEKTDEKVLGSVDFDPSDFPDSVDVSLRVFQIREA